MPDTKIAFQKQMCVKARCETARCGEAARSGTTSTNCAEVRGGTDRGRGRGDKKGGNGGRKRKERPTALPPPRRTPPGSSGPAQSPARPGTRSVPCSLPCTSQLFSPSSARTERPRFFISGSLPISKPKSHVWSLK